MMFGVAPPRRNELIGSFRFARRDNGIACWHTGDAAMFHSNVDKTRVSYQRTIFSLCIHQAIGIDVHVHQILADKMRRR
jgi:hypothetical protein